MNCKSIVLVVIAIQISSTRQMEFVMLFCLGMEICDARLAFLRVRYFCTGYIPVLSHPRHLSATPFSTQQCYGVLNCYILNCCMNLWCKNGKSQSRELAPVALQIPHRFRRCLAFPKFVMQSTFTLWMSMLILHDKSMQHSWECNNWERHKWELQVFFCRVQLLDFDSCSLSSSYNSSTRL